jgi:MerR family mercuric resistance operon transcriptional regulator
VREKIVRLETIENVLSDMVVRCHAHRGNINCPLIGALHEGVTGTENRNRMLPGSFS